MYKRPQRGESEEDLLKLQEEFFKNKAENKLEPAAKLVGKIEIDDEQQPQEAASYEPPEQLSNTFETIPGNINIGNVVEKVRNTYMKSLPLYVNQNKGFPLAKRRDVTVKPTKGSIFSQQMKKFKKDDANSSSSTEQETKTESKMEVDKTTTNVPAESFILTGDDRYDIHKENVDIMNKMSEEEILEEREKLMSTMDPAIVAFLKSRRHHLSKGNEDTKPDMVKQRKVAEDMKAEDIVTVSEILRQPKAERWLHFDKMETTKLAWMKDVDVNEIKMKEGYEARFDFGGWLLSYAEKEINETNRTLYHHGDEPNRPGYTLQELFQLCRSNIIQQKVTALNSVANLLSLETSGIYDNIIDIPMEQVFFVLRFCLDDNAPSVLNAGIKAMRNLFYYPIDEACVDSLLGFGVGLIQPTLMSEEEDLEDNDTVNDQQLAESNLVKCLARTDILVRIRYILNTVRPAVETVTYCLELLIRLVRDSLRIAMLVYKCENLIGSIVKQFVPTVFNETLSGYSYSLPLRQAVKLLRILSTRSRSIASELVNKYNIMDPILIYLSNEHFSSNTNGIQLQTESLHFWSVLINYNLALHHFEVMQPILLQMLHYHIQSTNMDMSSTYTIQGHVAALLNLIGQVALKRFQFVLPYLPMLSGQATYKWTKQFSHLNNFLCGKLLIISSLLNCLTCILKSKPSNDDINYENIYVLVLNMLNSKGFLVVTSDVKSGSNILSKHDVHTASKNLLTMEAAMWNASEHVVPVLQTNSCVPFLCALSNFVTACDHLQLKLAFLQHEHVKNYFAVIKNCRKFNLTSNWFTRIESTLILNSLRISVSVQRSIDTSLFYEVAVKCLCVFNSEQKADIEFLLVNIIFNKNYYPSDVLMRNLDIVERNSMLTSCLNNLGHICETYKEVLSLKSVAPCSDSLCADIKIGNIIPIDWIYSPIIALYSNKQHDKESVSEEKLIFIVTNCLRWIYIYESYFSGLASMVDPVDKFCRLACVFLGSDDLFFIPEIHNLLEQCLRHLMANKGTDLDFSKPVQGLNNFQDFYTQLLEQYQGVSYGDILFGNVILIPLMQKQDVKYRKILWSEYAGIVQICNIRTDQLLCPLEMFLHPAEVEQSLLHCYTKALKTRMIRQESVLYAIATHHLHSYTVAKKS